MFKLSWLALNQSDKDIALLKIAVLLPKVNTLFASKFLARFNTVVSSANNTVCRSVIKRQ